MTSMALLVAVLPLFIPLQDAKPEDPAKTAISSLKEATRSKDTLMLQDALLRAGKVSDKKVVSAIGKHMAHKDQGVRLAAAEALRWMEHEDAWKALEGGIRKNKKDEDVLTAIFLGIGQHADPKSVKVLGGNMWNSPYRDVVEVRIHALGRVRDKSAVGALVKMMVAGKPRTLGRHWPALRSSLQMLTGEDHGTDAVAWNAWWSKARAKFEVPPEPFALPRKAQFKVDKMWQSPAEAKADAERQKGRDKGDGRGEKKKDGDKGGKGKKGSGKDPQPPF